MSSERQTRYVPGHFLRPCDVCGIRFLSGDLVRGADGKFRCKKWCTEITNLEVDKLKAESHKRREAPPPPHAVPWERGDFAAEEAALFQALAEKEVVDPNWSGGVRRGIPPLQYWSMKGPGGPWIFATSYSLQAAAWALIYLGAVVAEARRPQSWMVSAKAKIRSLADWLLTQQLAPWGTGDNTLTDTTAAWYGGFVRGTETTVYAEDVGAACMGLTRAYQATGNQRYLSAAALCVTCINKMMNGDKLTNYFTTSDLATTPWHAGMVTHRMLLDLAPG